MRSNRVLAVILSVSLSLLGGIFWAWAQSSQASSYGMAYEGYLEFDGVPITDTLDLQITFFAAPTGGTAIASESHTNVQAVAGRFQLSLGEQGLTTLNLKGPNVYIEITVTGQPSGTPIAPAIKLQGRQQLSATPYARRAAPGQDFAIDGSVGVGIGATAPRGRIDAMGGNGYAGLYLLGEDNIWFDGGQVRITTHDGHGNWQIKSGADNDDLYIASSTGAAPGAVKFRLDEAGTAMLQTAGSGTVGNAIAWNTGLQVDSAGKVGVGGAPGAERLTVAGKVTATDVVTPDGMPIGHWRMIDEQILTANAASISFSGIATGYQWLKLEYSIASADATNQWAHIRFNNDAAANYSAVAGCAWTAWSWGNAGDTKSVFGLSARSDLNNWSVGETLITNITGQKVSGSTSFAHHDPGPSACIGQAATQWYSTAKVTSIQLFLANTTSFRAGSRVSLWAR